MHNMTMLEHLAELRGRLIKAILALTAGGLTCLILYPYILDLILRPYCETFTVDQRIDSGLFGSEGGCSLFVTNPLEPFNVRLTIAGYGGLVLTMPVILWQVWKFVAPGLYRNEKRYALIFVISGMVLFIAGVALAYWSLPRALDFLALVGGDDLVSIFSPQLYLGFVIKMMVAFGLAFQFPIALVALQALGILSNRTLRKNRSYAIIGVVVLVAVITPSGDPFTLLILSVPMYVFYETAILYGVISGRIARKKSTSRTDRTPTQP